VITAALDEPAVEIGARASLAFKAGATMPLCRRQLRTILNGQSYSGVDNK
jgi:hypothetical protein